MNVTPQTVLDADEKRTALLKKQEELETAQVE